ncbi:MAG: cytochrome P450 [Hyphomicrobiaceae bacterium]
MTSADSTALFLDPHDPSFVADPYSTLAQLRQFAPVHWSPPLRAWVVTRYDDVHAVLHDKQLSADTVTPFYKAQPSDTQAKIASLMRYLGNWLVFKDPPDHTRIRNLTTRVFTSRALAPVRANIEKISADLLCAMQPDTEIDLVATYSNPLPAYVIMDMLGMPRSLLPDMKRWSDEIKLFIGSARSVPDKYDRARAGVEAMADAFRDVIEDHRRRPREDVLSLLVEARDDDDGRLSDDELVATCILFLFAGHETTTNLITMASLHMMQRPAQRSRFLALESEAEIEAATEEFLRFDGPTPSMVRIAVQDHQLGGQTIKAGERIYAMIAAANRDPEVFVRADELDIGRSAKRHYAFGYGTHFCLGAPLARLEAAIAIPALHRQFPRMQLTADAVWADGMTLRGPVRLPVHLGPAFRPSSA